MMHLDAQQRYETWLNDDCIDAETKKELWDIAHQPEEIKDRFYRDLEFGTGGIRGLMGAGTNRFNPYVVSKVTQGYATYLLSRLNEPSVVIAYDSRLNSASFALIIALVLAGNGIKTYLFRSLRPTPQLSFSVRHLEASGGIMITASHNPSEYNGYKVYNADGGQFVPKETACLSQNIGAVHSFAQVKNIKQKNAEKKGLMVWLGEEADACYVDAVIKQLIHPAPLLKTSPKELAIVYTPLHGAGGKLVPRILAHAGFSNVAVVPGQAQADGRFPTVLSPNPEDPSTYQLACQLATQLRADLIVATDPDVDRVGVVVRDDNGEFRYFNGNQIGAILTLYILSNLTKKKKLPPKAMVIMTIVTSDLGAEIAKSYGCQVFRTLTGFKYIGEKITQYTQENSYAFVFGYEESCGYLKGTYARDKDACVATMLICEAAAYYKTLGKSLIHVLGEIYAKYGCYLENLISRTYNGTEGRQKIAAIMQDWRGNKPQELAGVTVLEVLDYALGLNSLPKENVLKIKLADGSWVALRPSGTEPKLKIYFAVRSGNEPEANEKLKKLMAVVLPRVDGKLFKE